MLFAALVVEQRALLGGSFDDAAVDQNRACRQKLARRFEQPERAPRITGEASHDHLERFGLGAKPTISEAALAIRECALEELGERALIKRVQTQNLGA